MIRYHQHHKEKDRKGGKGDWKGSKKKEFICFDHDPRKGKICQKQECQNDPVKQHLDTKQPDLAARFDRAKSAFEANKASGKGKHP